eukprot:gnl/TRDRNA2_/TRDRNA2_43895_c0_seq1.p1 gnl/TRDRNA2_/TRDRNA2_43895_c0~~gnl/TRDRNA2_/TRDRNA2_43895_c0_seq1.p1  ORF type:complete len:541 (-),score=101.57 gnl/TRDRNA2_/TRDRNA2_43895_c0_seq1:71-1693(-)
MRYKAMGFLKFMMPLAQLLIVNLAADHDPACEVSNGTCATSDVSSVPSELFDWILSKGGTINGVELRQYSHTERGVVTSRHLPKGTTVLVLPVALITTIERARSTPLGAAVQRASEKETLPSDDLEGLLLATWLLHETGAGETSSWSTYLSSLPSWFPTMPFNFSDADIKTCAGGVNSTEEYLYFGKQLLEKELELLLAMPEAAAAKVTRERYLWARFMSFSRTFTVSRLKLNADLLMSNFFTQARPKRGAGDASKPTESTQGLPKSAVTWDTGKSKDEASVFVPLADMINHVRGRAVNCNWQYTGLEGFTVTTKKDLPPGEELTITYGNKGNQIFLAHYGFAEAGNPHDQLSVTLRFPAAGGRAPMEVPLKLDGAHPSSVEDMNRVLDACREHVRLEHARFGATDDGMGMQLSDLEVEAAAMRVLLAALAEAAKVYMPPPDCAPVCVAFRGNLLELLGTWRVFAEHALMFVTGEEGERQGADLSAERFALHARLYIGIWLRTGGRKLVYNEELLQEAATYGNVNYYDLIDLDVDFDNEL